MAPAIGCGIDFGTSNSAIAVAWPDRVQVVAAETTAPVLPSIVYLHRAGDQGAGGEAVERFFATGHVRTSCGQCSLAPYGISECRQFRRDGGCNDARLLSGLKHDLAKSGFTGTNSWCTDFSAAALVTVILRRLRSVAERQTGERLRRAVLGHPVVFAGEDHPSDHEVALGRLREAAAQAGFDEVEFVTEPEAALASGTTAGAVTLAADFGGGTFDAAVLTARGEVAGLHGVAVGGERLDQVLFETRIGPELGLDVLPNWLFNEMRSLSGVRLLLTDPGLPFLLERFGGPAARLAREILFEGHALGFYRALEEAKIRLSADTHTRAAYPRLNVSVPLSRAHFEVMIRPELERVTEAMGAALDEAAVAPDEVELVVCTGGTSQVPAFQRLLGERFPRARVERRDAFTSVVEGLGQAARRRWSPTPAAAS